MASQNPSSPVVLPVITAQHTFPEVLKEVQDGIIPFESFWVSCYKSGEPSVHAKIRAELDDVNRNQVNLVTMEGELETERRDERDYRVSCAPLSITPTRIVTPVQEYTDPERSNPRRPNRIVAFAISPDASRFATGFLDGSVLLYPTSSAPNPPSLLPQAIDTTNAKTTSRPHLSSITYLKFFPSSRVLLSAGADFSLCILPADLPPNAPVRIEPARTLRAHKRSITSTAIIGVGRNILSSSLDSTIKLWDVPSASVITSLSTSSAVLCMSIGGRSAVLDSSVNGAEPATAQDQREAPEVQSQLVFAGMQNGSFELFDLALKKSVHRSPPSSSSITAISYSSEHHLLATGSSGGIVSLYDTHDLAQPLNTFLRTQAEVEDVTFIPSRSGDTGVRLAVATADGLPYVASYSPTSGPGVSAELIGADCDPVRNVHARGQEVWTASDDGIVRRYLV
ncbi:WD40-repeat-containing domain protein [Crucibulum laeve]|uniref:WD40-repeat-containing domain protein n=1 Tax=Crucibulum laeve TaxID=68775 RepID=A0A5C3LXI4_9AGAR|nr:WD40-repeat-containing domain protein [Crucibulum laeve]